MRTAARLVGGALALLLGGCYDPPIPHVPPQTPSGKFEVTADGVGIECMQRRMRQNLIRNGFQLVATNVPGQIVADNAGIRSIYSFTQEGPNVRVFLDPHTIGSDGKIAPLAEKEITQRRQIMFVRSIDSVIEVCKGQSPAGSDTFTTGDLKK